MSNTVTLHKKTKGFSSFMRILVGPVTLAAVILVTGTYYIAYAGFAKVQTSFDILNTNYEKLVEVHVETVRIKAKEVGLSEKGILALEKYTLLPAVEHEKELILYLQGNQPAISLREQAKIHQLATTQADYLMKANFDYQTAKLNFIKQVGKNMFGFRLHN